MRVTVRNKSGLSISAASVKRLVLDFNQFYHCNADEVAVYFVDKKKIGLLHAQFFQDPAPTDCLSFPMDETSEHGYRVLGDIFVCPAVAEEYVNGHGGSLYQEITLYLIHGLLHLIGYDDLKREELLKMRKAEKKYLSHIEEKKLWLFSKNEKNAILVQ